MKKTGTKRAKDATKANKLKFLKEVVHTSLEQVQGGSKCTDSDNSCLPPAP